MNHQYYDSIPFVPRFINPLNSSLGLPDVYLIGQACNELQFNAQTIEQGFKVRYDSLGVAEAQEGLLTQANLRSNRSSLQAASSNVWEVLRRLHVDKEAQQRAQRTTDTVLTAEQLGTAWVCPPITVRPPAVHAEWLQALSSSVPLESLVHPDGAVDTPGGAELHVVLRMLANWDVPLPRALWYLSCLLVNRLKHPAAGESLPGALQSARSSALEVAFTKALDSVLLDLQHMQQQQGTSGAGRASPASLGLVQSPEDMWLYLLHLLGQLHIQGVVCGLDVVEWVLNRLKALLPSASELPGGPPGATVRASPPRTLSIDPLPLASAPLETVQQYLAAWGGLVPLLKLCCLRIPPSHALWCSTVTQAADLLLAAQRGLPGALQTDAGNVLTAVAALLQQLVSVCPAALVQLPARVCSVCSQLNCLPCDGASALTWNAKVVSGVAATLAADVRSRVVEFQCAAVAEQLLATRNSSVIATRIMSSQSCQPAALLGLGQVVVDMAVWGPCLPLAQLGNMASVTALPNMEYRAYAVNILQQAVQAAGGSVQELTEYDVHVLISLLTSILVQHQAVEAPILALLPRLLMGRCLQVEEHIRWVAQQQLSAEGASAHLKLLQQLPPALYQSLLTCADDSPALQVFPGTVSHPWESCTPVPDTPVPPSQPHHTQRVDNDCAVHTSQNAGAAMSHSQAPKRRRIAGPDSRLAMYDSAWCKAVVRLQRIISGSSGTKHGFLSNPVPAPTIACSVAAEDDSNFAASFLQPLDQQGTTINGHHVSAAASTDKLAMQAGLPTTSQQELAAAKKKLRRLLGLRDGKLPVLAKAPTSADVASRETDGLAEVLQELRALKEWQRAVVGTWLHSAGQAVGRSQCCYLQAALVVTPSLLHWATSTSALHPAAPDSRNGHPFQVGTPEGALHLLRWLTVWDDGLGDPASAVKLLCQLFVASARHALLADSRQMVDSAGPCPSLASCLCAIWLTSQLLGAVQVCGAARSLAVCISAAVLHTHPQPPDAAARAALEPWAASSAALLPQAQGDSTAVGSQVTTTPPSASTVSEYLQAPSNSWWVTTVQQAAARLAATSAWQWSQPANAAVLSSMAAALQSLQGSSWMQPLESACQAMVQPCSDSGQFWSHVAAMSLWYTSTSPAPPHVPQPVAIAKAACVGSSLVAAWCNSARGSEGAWQLAVGLLQLTLSTPQEELREYLEAALLHSMLTAPVKQDSVLQDPPCVSLLVCCLAAGSLHMLPALRFLVDELVKGSANSARKLAAAWLRLLLGPADALAAGGANMEVAACIPRLQHSLPASLLYELLKQLLLEAAAGCVDCLSAFNTAISNDVIRGVCCSAAASLAGPVSRDLSVPVSDSMNLMLSRLWAEAVVSGRRVSPQDLTGADSQDTEEGEVGPSTVLLPPRTLMQHILLTVTTSNCAAAGLMVRVCADQVAYGAALSRGLTQGDAAAAAASAAAACMSSSNASKVGEEEKSFTSMALRSLLQRPAAAELVAAVTRACGVGLMDYLLQQCEWLLQDSTTFSGQEALAVVLDRRYGNEASAGSTTAQAPVVLTGPPPGPFSVEEGLVHVALVCLVNSNASRRREFAQQLIGQLSSIATMLHSDASAHKEGHGPEGDEGAPAGLGSRKSGGFGSGRLRRAVGGSAAAVTPGPPAGVHVAIWLRLKLLLPLLPIVYQAKETDPQRNLRIKLASAIVRLCHNPTLWACNGEDLRKGLNTGSVQPSPTPTTAVSSSLEAAATAAACMARETLFDRLLHILTAVLADDWAEWLRGDRKLRPPDKLDMVPLYPLLQQLPQDMPVHLRNRLLAAVPCPLYFPPSMPGNTAAAVRIAGTPLPPGQEVPVEQEIHPWLMSRIGLKGMQLPINNITPTASASCNWLVGSVYHPRQDALFG